MRAAQMTERPVFDLMKQNDVQNIYYMQMPRWLFSDPRYAPMSLDAKVTYTFLLNRFQLSRMNGWVNERGEVFVIFPRKTLAQELRICEQRVTAAFRKLVELDLVWEKRCGRGEANQIYLAKVTPQSDPDYSCAPFLEMPEDSETEYSSPEDSRTADIEVLDENGKVDETGLDTDPVDAQTEEDVDQADAQIEEVTDVQDDGHTEETTDAQVNERTVEITDKQVDSQSDNPVETPEPSAALDERAALNVPISGPETCGQFPLGVATPNQEPQNLRFKNSGFGGSRTADFEVQEPQNLRSNKIDMI